MCEGVLATQVAVEIAQAATHFSTMKILNTGWQNTATN